MSVRFSALVFEKFAVERFAGLHCLQLVGDPGFVGDFGYVDTHGFGDSPPHISGITSVNHSRMSLLVRTSKELRLECHICSSLQCSITELEEYHLDL
jgi:hypothetical protein